MPLLWARLVPQANRAQETLAILTKCLRLVVGQALQRPLAAYQRAAGPVVAEALSPVPKPQEEQGPQPKAFRALMDQILPPLLAVVVAAARAKMRQTCPALHFAKAVTASSFQSQALQPITQEGVAARRLLPGLQFRREA
jgi:hypothetical protein